MDHEHGIEMGRVDMERESILVVAPLALSPSVPPGLGPVDHLNSVRAPFHVHPPHFYTMLVVHSYPTMFLESYL